MSVQYLIYQLTIYLMNKEKLIYHLQIIFHII